MFNSTLFRQIAASNHKLFIVITAILSALITVIMSVFVPSTISQIAEANKNAGLNPLGDISTLSDFVGNQYFGMFALILCIIYTVVLGNRMIAGQVDRGSMAYHLAAPISRTTLTVTSAIYLVSSLAVMFAIVFGVGCGVAEIAQPGKLDISTFLTLTFGFFLLQTALSGIVFVASCVFNRSSQSLTLGAGISIFFFVANLLSGLSSKLESLKHITIITLYDSKAIINDGSYVSGLIILIVIGIIFFAAGIVTFRRKDLPL
ncbi:ABC transporter permease subunit [Paenibacillus glycanilyticus]|uniref:ABC transporter permease subunit n=1 Tax=Paenibacillus glycanilyticus TaxID=126569 RepID=UPI0013E3AA05|nr:ABC transporter permease subunit [Paenibacillus glycanilyticus]